MARKREKIGGVSFLPAEIKFESKDGLFKIAQDVAKTVESMSTNFTDDDIQQAKKVVANSRKETTDIDRIRKEVKKSIIGNYPEFEQDVKAIIAVIDDAEKELRTKIKAQEEREQEQKFETICEMFELNERKYPFVKDGSVTIENVFEDKWLNKSVSTTKIEQAINEKLLAIQNDLSVIESDANATRLKALYMQSMNLTQAMVTLNNQLAQEAAVTAQPEPSIPAPTSDITEHILTVETTPAQWEQLQIYLKRNGITYQTI